MTAPRLETLTAGMAIPYGGDKLAVVSPDLAARFRAGDSLLVLQDTGALLRVPAEVRQIAAEAVGRAHEAFRAMARVSDDQITRFFDRFAAHLEDDDRWSAIARANAADVERAQARGRSTTRLAVGPALRRDMIAGLREWRDAAGGRGRVLERIEHAGWRLEQIAAPLGVVGFIFEGRPNVFADATGVLRTGNTVVFRIGADALGTARAIVAQALDPALAEAGLPAGAASLVDSAEHAAGWAMFGDPRLALAVARGSGSAVAQLGAIARQAGAPVSLHGTGGAWLIAGEDADPARFAEAVYHSLDRKVCNTLNVCCIPESRADDLIPLFLDALRRAGARRGEDCKLHVVETDRDRIPADWLAATARVRRAEGERSEPRVESVILDDLGREWEWEDTPEVTLKIVADVDEAIALFNRHAPRLVASLISNSEADHQRFFDAVEAPFIGDGFTRWVDGQYALNRPELGLSNWQGGRLLARSAVLAGDGVYTVRSRARQQDPHLDRQTPAAAAPGDAPIKGERDVGND